MHKTFVFIATVLIFLLTFVPVFTYASGDDESSGGCSGGGGQLKEIDKADSYGLIDTHAFHTVRGITVLNVVQGDGNLALANTNVYFVGNEGEVNSAIENETDSIGAEDNSERQYNRIAAHAFHDVKGVTMVQMIAGNGNMVTANLNVTITAGFMANASDLFYTESGH